jgi:thioredoxin reductase
MNNVAIIGAGPAGLSTAIQLKRYNIESLLFEGNLVGGLLRNANLVENYPGFPRGISGIKLVNIFLKHLNKAGVNVVSERVLELDNNNGIFTVKTAKRVTNFKIAVIASGTKPKKIQNLFLPPETVSCVFYEVYPIINEVNKNILIIGAGDTAFDYALNLSVKNKVTIFNRSTKIKCLPLLLERVMGNKNISYEENTVVKNIIYDNKELKITYYNRTIESIKHFSYLVIAVGRIQNKDFICKNINLNLDKLLKSKSIFIIGDAKNNIYRQTAIAAGDGIKTAMDINIKFKEELRESNS